MRPKLAAGVPALQRGESIPIGPFAAHDVFRLNHAKELSISAGCSSVVLDVMHWTAGRLALALAGRRTLRAPRREQLELLEASEEIGGEEVTHSLTPELGFSRDAFGQISVASSSNKP